MDWKRHFTTAILNRGKKYYDQLRVDDFTDEGSKISAIVWGTDSYIVHIFHPGTDRMIMRCTCPHAQKGMNCKHMAAVLWMWDEISEEKMDQNAPPVFPPFENGREPFFNIPKIASEVRITQKAASEARKLIEEERIALNGFDLYYDTYSYGYYSRTSPVAFTYGIFRGDNINYKVRAMFTNKELRRYDCEVCGDHYYGYYSAYDNRKKKPCAHVTAFLMLLDEHTRRFDPGDYTDYNATAFLRQFDREKIKYLKAERQDSDASVVLEPRIAETATGLELSFRISNGGKFYVVKNLTDLYDTVSERKEFPLGKKDSVDFAREHFDPDSEKLFAMIEQEVKRSKAIERKMEQKRTYQYQGSLEAGKGIPFVGNIVDTIYELNFGGTLEFKRLEDKGKGKGNVQVGEYSPLIEVIVEPQLDHNDGGPDSKKSFSGIIVTGEIPVLLDGSRNRYFISDKYFGILDDETWSHIRPFAEATDFPGTYFDFLIGEKNATSFYYDILPELRADPVFSIQERDEIPFYICDEAAFSFYLDAEGGDITCKGYVDYGDGQIPLVRLRDSDLPLPEGRDLNQELPVYNLLNDLFANFDHEGGVYISAPDDDARYRILRDGIDKLMLHGEVNATEAFSRQRVRRTPVVQIGLALESDLLDLKILTNDLDPDEIKDLIDSYRLKKKYHRLKSGQFVDLQQNESMDMLMGLAESLGVSPSELAKGRVHIPSYRALYLESMLAGHEELVSSRDRTYKNLLRDFKTISDADFDPPETLKDILRPYQDYGFRWLKTLERSGFGGILADDMGLGKTLQVIALILSGENAKGNLSGENAEGGTALVVCPASLVYNWMEEIRKFAPDLNAAAVAGTKRERRNILDNYKDYDILITSYDLLKRDIDLYEEPVFSHQIIDEAQYIKNAGSAAAKSVKLIHASHRFALTGTPIENRLGELWSIFDYLMPGFLFRYDEFRKKFEAPISKNGDEQQSAALRSMVAPFLLRRKKGDVLNELPDKLEEVHYARLEGQQLNIYNGQVLKIKEFLQSSDDISSDRIQILAQLTRIRQICCDPSLLFDDYQDTSAKREACIDLVKSAIDGDHRILLFSQFTSMLDILKKDLEEEGIDYFILTGSTPKKERIRLVNEFNSGKVPVFLISLKAGGTGLNLTGADVVIHYDPWWNVAAQNQATDRAHRIGQTKTVTVYQLIAKGTIEEKILSLQETKKELAETILTGESKSLATMSREELLELLSVQ